MKQMRKGLTFAVVLGLTLGLFGAAAFAGTYTTGSAVIPISGAGVSVEMEGTVTPTILTVTMPATIAFEIGRSADGENKVLSPEVPVINGSEQGVRIFAQSMEADFSQMPGVQYVPSTSGGSIDVITEGALNISGAGIVTGGPISVESNEIAIGMSAEWVPTSGAVMPSLEQARWLIEDPYGQSVISRTEIAYVPGNGQMVLRVVGTLGRDVPEERSFTLRPTFIASY